jgi:anti-anti-sigma factor
MTLLELSGYLDFESSRPVAEQIESVYLNNNQARILIDMSELEFIGSSGISNFVKGLRVFNRFHMRPSYVGVKQEFQKLFKIFEEKNSFEVFEEKEHAVKNLEEKSLV